MARLSQRQLLEYLDLGYELRGVEFKSGGPTSDKNLVAKVARAVMGMANRRDGGVVVVGVADRNDGALERNGVDAEHLQGWNHDGISGKVATYADPYVNFEVQILSRDGASFVFLVVDEFDETPVLCRRDYGTVLRAGGLCVGRFGPIETSEVPTSAEMREILDLAGEKAARRILIQAQRAGLSGPPPNVIEYDKELKELT